MYCPKCGSQNQEELKFCTRCGTNLSSVAKALSEKADDKPSANDPMVELLRKYYEGRQSTAVGVGSMLVGLAVLIIRIKLDLPELLNLVAMCAFIYGAIAIIAGIAEWIQASSTMKAINHSALKKSPTTAAQELPPSSAKVFDTAPTGDSFQEPLAVSVTEQTTRQLEERFHENALEKQ
jgi:hypothetical protein